MRFVLDRYYMFDDSYPGRFNVYEDGCFVCSGLTLRQALDYYKGASLSDLNILQLSL